MQAVILAGGEGKRLRPLTHAIPKAMIRIAGKPFLEHQISLLKRNSVDDIVVCIGYLGNRIRSYFRDGTSQDVMIRYSDDGEKLLGTAGCLKNAKDLLAERFFIVFGDSYPILDYPAAWNRFLDCDKASMMVVLRNNDSYCPSNTVVQEGMVTAYSKRSKIPEMDCVEFGVTFLSRNALKIIPDSEPVDLELLYSRLIEAKQMAALEVSQRIYEIGSPQGLEEFRALFESGKIVV